MEGYQPPTEAPDLVGQKRKLGLIDPTTGRDAVTGQTLEDEDNDDTARAVKKKRAKAGPSRRLFVGKLPLRITASALRDALQRAAKRSNARTRDIIASNAVVPTIQWIVDPQTRAFYGSAYCDMASIQDAEAVMASVASHGGRLEVGKSMKSRKKRETIRRARVAFCAPREDETWPCENHRESEYPPIGII